LITLFAVIGFDLVSAAALRAVRLKMFRYRRH
jgi:hypothetical protein